jgi:hypothetical protein
VPGRQLSLDYGYIEMTPPKTILSKPAIKESYLSISNSNGSGHPLIEIAITKQYEDRNGD